MELTPEEAAEFRSILSGMAEKIKELEADVVRLKAEHEELKAEQAQTRAMLDALLAGNPARDEPDDATPGDEDQHGD